MTEHVGSTAVPGSKPIIDLDVVVPDAQAAGRAVRALAAAGWQHEGTSASGAGKLLPAPGLPYHHLYTVAGSGPDSRSVSANARTPGVSPCA